MLQDFNHRISIVINRELPSWQILNTVAHISAYFGHKLDSRFGTGEYLESKDGVHLPRNSQFPFIALSASLNELFAFAKKVRGETDIQSMFFTREMIETTNDHDLANAISQKNVDEIELCGVGIFGENKRVKALTRDFKLWS